MMDAQRKSGILLHISSLPGRYGIGTLGYEAFKFVDFLKSANQKIWQILPLGHTGFTNSPYQCFSAFAGNPLLISIEKLVDYGYVSASDLPVEEEERDKVDFNKVFSIKFPLLRKAFSNFSVYDRDYVSFCEENAYWLEGYSSFMALKRLDSKAWYEWDYDLKKKNYLILREKLWELREEVEFYKFLQFCFFKQWKELKEYANKNGVLIIGDIPIFVALDSADVWYNPEIFELDENLMPVRVAGVPPDYFSATGQLWGNPLYRWNVLEETGYEWWIKRFEKAFEMYDLVRVDHFRGFCGYWAIPAGEKTAVNGKWEKGPGKEFFLMLKNKLGVLPIIAEDLGVITDDVVELREFFSFPGMKVLQFGFEDGSNSEHLPHNYKHSNFVVYTGTHDNNTLVGWLGGLSEDKKIFINSYLNLPYNASLNEISFNIIRLAFSSTSVFSIIPIQDVLFLDASARMNLPGTAFGNWEWKLTNHQIENARIDFLREFCYLYNR